MAAEISYSVLFVSTNALFGDYGYFLRWKLSRDTIIVAKS